MAIKAPGLPGGPGIIAVGTVIGLAWRGMMKLGFSGSKGEDYPFSN
jgi:hypothetical protein